MYLNKEKTNSKEDSYMKIGESKDYLEEYLHAANTGHLVFTTISQNNAVETFKRLKNLGIER